MATFSPTVERWRALVSKYFAPADVNAALAVIGKESGGNSSVPSAYNAQGTEDSHGLFQINIQAHGGTPAKWSDPETNIAYAAQLKDAAGNWRDWLNSANSLGLPVTGSGNTGGTQMSMTPEELAYLQSLGSGGGDAASPKLEWIEIPPGSGKKYPYTFTNGRLEPVEGLPAGPYPEQASADTWVLEVDPSTGKTYGFNKRTLQKVEIFDAPPAKTAEPKIGSFTDPSDGSVWRTENGYKKEQLSPPIPGYRPSGVDAPEKPLRLAPRYADQEEAARLANEKARQDLDPNGQLFVQMDSVIKAVQAQLAKGEIDSTKATELIGLARQNVEATLQGTTPWQIKTQADKLAAEQKARQDTLQASQNTLAGGFIGDQVQGGASMASSLLTGANSAYGKILGSSRPPTNFDPMLMAKGFVQDMGGGPEMTELAKKILAGALQPRAQGEW